MFSETISIKNLELHEARYWRSLYLNADKSLQKKLGLLTANGFTHYNNWCKHIRELSEYQPLPDNGLSVVKLQPDEVDQFAGIMNLSFDFGYDPENLVVSVYGRPEYHFYLPKNRDKPVDRELIELML